MNKFDFDDTNSTGIWWSTNVAIRDEVIALKEDTGCDDSEIVEFLRSIAQNIESYGLWIFQDRNTKSKLTFKEDKNNIHIIVIYNLL